MERLSGFVRGHRVDTWHLFMSGNHTQAACALDIYGLPSLRRVGSIMRYSVSVLATSVSKT